MNITVSIETALSLKEAGWVKECEFGVYKVFENEHPFISTKSEAVARGWEIDCFICDAPTAEELLDEFNDDFDFVGIKIEAKNLTEALASLWINHPECRISSPTK